jgi:transketolase
MAALNELETKAKWIRRKVLEMAVSSGKGHLGGTFSCVEILVALYYQIMKPEDKFILSKGHAAAALYCILADKGYFPLSELDTFCKDGSRLEGHPHIGIPGVLVNSGSLGHGLSLGAGMALANKIDGKEGKIYVLLSDGDCYEGSTWEAAMFASHHQLSNLIAIVDRNFVTVTGLTENYLKLENLVSKWRAFAWSVGKTNDGHSFPELIGLLTSAREYKSTNMLPRVLIMQTIKGKGVYFMHHQAEWHNSIPTGEQLEIARRELE